MFVRLVGFELLVNTEKQCNPHIDEGSLVETPEAHVARSHATFLKYRLKDTFVAFGKAN